MRNVALSNEEIYHICNRGVDKRDIFSDVRDLNRFLDLMVLLNSTATLGCLRDFMREQNTSVSLASGTLTGGVINGGDPLVEFVSFCLLPNHYHFLLRQKADNGIEKFMHKLSTSHTKYYNTKYDRSGSLFQGTYKSKHVDTNEYLIWLAAYVNLNDKVHSYDSKSNLISSSWGQIIGENKNPRVLVEPSIILSQYRNSEDFNKTAIETLAIIKQNKQEQRRSEFL